MSRGPIARFPPSKKGAPVASRGRSPAKRVRVHPTVATFARAVDRLIAPLMTERGFVVEARDIGSLSGSVRYGKGERYIVVTIGVGPHDWPGYCGAKFGEGARNWPECDWNSVALSLLAPRRPRLSKGMNVPPTPVLARNVPRLVAEVRDQLLILGAGFLRGNMTRFRRVRAATNKKREPYRILTPTDGGSYRTEWDSKSDSLRKRFGTPENGGDS
jgi:hypothetical protein